MEKITKKEMFTRIATAMAEDSVVVEFCEKEIAALERKAERAKENAAKKRAEGDALTEKVFAAVTSEMESIDTILARVDDEDATKGKVQFRLSAMAKDGKIAKGEITIGEGTSKRKVVAYALV